MKTMGSGKLVSGGLAAALMLGAGVASAAVLYEQQPSDGGDSYYAAPSVGQQLVDDFALTFTADVEQISWWGGYDGNIDAGDDSFRVRLYGNVAASGSVLHEFNSASATRTAELLVDSVQNAIYKYTFALPTPVQLGMGSYFLFVENLGSSDWVWVTSATGGNGLWFRDAEGNNWLSFDQNLAMQIEGSRVTTPVPEPGTLALLGLAGIGGLLARRRRL